MSDDLVRPAATPGVSALAAVPPRGDPTLDLSGAQRGRTSERLVAVVVFLCGALSIFTTVAIVLVLIGEAISFFREESFVTFVTGTEWTGWFADGQFGVLPLVYGTLSISLIAMLVAIPLGLMSAIYLSEYAPMRVRAVLKPVLELLAGIPTVVYGYFALTFITPQVLRPILPGTNVYNALAAGIAVGIMILPMVASLSEDAMNAVPRALREGAYALGATKLEVSTRVVVPAALSGIFASFVLAVSRAVGETMIVALAAGSRAQITGNPLDPVQAMTGYIVQVFTGDVVVGSTVYKSLYAVGLLLFLMTLIMNIASQWLVSRFREVYQ